ncbi:MAG: cytochrome c-type biogenesis protein [Pseudomonadota bacterium]
MRWLFSLALTAMLMGAAIAQEAKLAEPLEARAQNLFEELRCVVCQNQTIGSSDADVARDLRSVVREKLTEGMTNQQVKNFLVARYGEFVLMKPAFAWHTVVLWVAPFALLVLGGIMAWLSAKRRRTVSTAKLSADEEKRLEALLNTPKK